MDRRRMVALGGAVLVGLVAGCTGDGSDGRAGETTGSGPAPDVDDEELAELIRSTNGFAFDLYHELLDRGSGENLFASPISITVALGMAYAGARRTTRAEMRDVLGLTLDDESFHETMSELGRALNERGGSDTDADGGDGVDGGGSGSVGDDDADGSGSGGDDDEPTPFELSVVNSMWGQEDVPFEESYLETLDDHYGSELREVDFRSDPDAVGEAINQWVADETADRIDELLPRGALDPTTRLVLVNAVYFLANWEHQFAPAATSDAPFTALDGSEYDVPTMRRERTWQYTEVDGAQAVELPYVGGTTSMLLILPPDGEFEEYERSFDGADLAELVDTLDARDGTVRLPRFEFEAGIQLSDVLAAMGMAEAFDDVEADFGDVARLDEVDEHLFLDEVYHEAVVTVDEDGTEAAAATGVVVQPDAGPVDAFEFVADRPFLFAIRDRPTDAVLFLGRVVDPAGWE